MKDPSTRDDDNRQVDDLLGRMLPGPLQDRYFRALETYRAEIDGRIEVLRNAERELINTALTRIVGQAHWARHAFVPQAARMTWEDREKLEVELRQFLSEARKRFDRCVQSLFDEAERSKR